MEDPALEALIHEYDQLAAYVNTSALNTFKLLPIVFTVGGGIIVYTQAQNPYIGIAASLAIFLMLLWLGLCHTMVNGIGLQLIETEQKINRRMRMADAAGLSFFSCYISEGKSILPGMKFYCVLFGISGTAALVFAHKDFWNSMTDWNWALGWKLSATVAPLLLIIAALLNIAFVEAKAYKSKKEILRRYARAEQVEQERTGDGRERAHALPAAPDACPSRSP